MMDFALLAKKVRDEMSPEQRARWDEHERKEREYEATARDITASFAAIGERYVFPGGLKLSKTPQKKVYEQYVVREWEKTIRMRMEGNILRFIGGSTGYEAFEATEDLVTVLEKDQEAGHEVFYICAGSPRYYRCGVNSKDVLDYIREVKPELFQTASSSLSM